MITAVDTNILLDILLPNEKFVDRSAQALEEAAAGGSRLYRKLFPSLQIIDPSHDEG